MIFNIYYINFPKVYEIKMMLSNVIALSKEKQTDKVDGKEVDYRGKLGVNFLNLFNIAGASLEGEAGRKNLKSDSQKVLETFEIKTTKSIILNEIIEKSNLITSFKNVQEGSLIKVDNVNLTLENEPELRTVKLFTSGSFKGMNIPGANGFDINNLFNSMFKDYAYKMKGIMVENDDELLVKIPMTFESEFESSYSVDDLFIGKVSVVGLYKGKIKIDSLKNSLEFFQEIGSMQNMISNKEEVKEIQDSQYTAKKENTDFLFASSKDEDKEFHYIDLLAIIQNVTIPNEPN
ncbi:hypothetical protein [Allomuricauda sp. NBRC 101325]|uniref:hypothetical protein n=1 Tax=Allomuricauda sp. NBRC 101325 TaxID=1113758 RepID=UPI0024A0E230|nr:hypothetical protein [Muricauda sp. NBRC 101325]GLU44117.1 hypothetical protein Musp01_17410 [Muricauda sp. NBRC 101325]